MVQAEFSPAQVDWPGLVAGQARRCGLVTMFACACGAGLAASERMQPLLVEFGRDGGGVVLGLWQVMAAGAAVSVLAMSLLGAYGSGRMHRPDQRPGLLGTSLELAGAVSAAGFVILGVLLVGEALAAVRGLADIPAAVCICLSTLLSGLGLGLLSVWLGPDRRGLTLSHLYGLGVAAKLQVFVAPVLLFGASLACLWSGASPAWTGALHGFAAIAPVCALLAGPPRVTSEQQQLMDFHARGDLSSPGPHILQ